MSDSEPKSKKVRHLEPVINNTDKWLEENSKYFLPPVCCKMMHNDGQMKSFYVGGPNQRKDYHIEEGEELFYMIKGDMVLKVIERGEHRDVPINEGEIFLLPGRIPHSPQRKADTIGLVIERERAEDEKDGLRYYVEKDGKPTLESLYEEWFHCEDLGSQLGPIIKRYFASEQHKTGKPIPGTIPEKPPIIPDKHKLLEDPFSLNQWLAENRTMIEREGHLNIFGEEANYQFKVDVYGTGSNTGKCASAETFIWMLEGTSTVTVDGKDYELHHNDTMLIRCGQEYSATRPTGALSLICYQDPTRKAKVFKKSKK